MGYNSILAIRFSDLDRIADTPEFASVLSRCAQRGITSPTGSAASSDLPDYKTSLAEVKDRVADDLRKADAGEGLPSYGDMLAHAKQKAMGHDWNIRVSCVTHSSGLCAAVLGGPDLIGSRLHAMEPADQRRDEWFAAARLLAGFGYEAKLAGKVIAPAAASVPKAFDLDAHLAREEERLAAHRANPAESVVAFTVLHDGFYEPGKDTELGARMRDTVLAYDKMHDAYMDGVRKGLIYSNGEMNFRMGNVSNGMAMIGLVPEGWQELVLMGGNYGRLLGPSLPIGAFQNGNRREVYEKIRNGDINELIRGLDSAGITVKAPGKKRHPPLYRARSLYMLSSEAPAALDECGPTLS